MSPTGKLPITIKEAISLVEEIPTISHIDSEVRRLISSGAGAEDIARVLEGDQIVSQLMLHHANVAFNAPSKRVEDVDRAIALLGVGTLQRLVRQATMSTALVPFAQSTMIEYWRYCYATAQAARILSEETRAAHPEEAFTVGLLATIGQAMLMVKFPSEYKQLIEDVEATDVYLLDAETDRFGINHSEFGYLLVRRWRMRESIARLVQHYYEPEKAGELMPFAVMLYLAGTITSGLGIGDSGVSRIRRSPVRADTWRDLGWSELDLERICSQVVSAAEAFDGFWELLSGRH